jgi:AraC family transcriptional activator of tynA and feaB
VNAEPAIQHFSTRGLPKGTRFDCWMNVMKDSLWQVTDWREVPADFNVELRGARLGALATMVEDMTAHHSLRTTADVARSAERSYHLFVSLRQAWAFTHMGRHERLEPGDVVMMGEGTHETHVPTGFSGVIVKCPEAWMQTWLPEPGAMAGRTIARDSGWGRVLSPLLSQLTPEFVTGSPLPHAVLVDQLGATLALMAGDADARAQPALLARALDCIRQRCAEPALSAADVAATLDVPARVLHKALAAGRTTFGSALLQARVERAVPLLGASASSGHTVADIARQAGFASASHFARVVRQRTGRPPQAWRRAAGAAMDPEQCKAP